MNWLLHSMLKKRKRLTLIENYDYKLLDTIDEYENNPVMILKGTYQGILVLFGTVSVEGVKVKFNYKVLENPNNLDIHSEEFRFFLGELISNIIVSN